MEIKNDKTLNLCMLAIFAKSSGISKDSVESFLKTNNYEFDKEILEYYMNNVDQLLELVNSELMVVETVASKPVESKVVEQKTQEVKIEPEVDFSAFF